MPTSTDQDGPFMPQATVPEKGRIRYKDPTLTIWLSRIWLSSFQLTTVAGAAVLAKTVVAPLERVKVRAWDWISIHLDRCRKQ